MAIIFSDSFAGAAGTLDARVPDVSFGAVTWQSSPGGGGVVLDGAGAVETEGYYGPRDESSSGNAWYDFGSLQLNPGIQVVEVSFSLITPASLASAGSSYLTGMVLSVYCSDANVAVRIFATYGSGVTTWYLRLGPNDAYVEADITAGLAASTAYTGVLSVTDGAQSVSFAGYTLNNTLAYNDSQYGIGQLDLRMGGFYKLDALAVADSVTPAGVAVLIGVPSPLRAPRALVYQDFTGVLGDAISVYVMDLITPAGPVRVPISSWQATLQTGASNYVQCVVPACAAWFAALNTATEFVIYRRAVLPSGAAIEYEMARAPASTVQYDQGPERYTCTLSGYSPAFAASATPNPGQDRALTGVRSVSIGRAMRVRCAVDWLLRPGQRALVQGVPMPVRYINYYAPSGFDSYMDVGGEA